MKAVLVNYRYTPDWLNEPEYKDLDYIIADRSEDPSFLKDFPQERIRYTANRGDVDYDKLSYLIEHYDDLPDVFLWSKTNIFKFISKEEFDKVKDNQVFTPLLTMNHKTYSDKLSRVCYYANDIYWERADSWFFNAGLDSSGKFGNWHDWTHHFGLPNTQYIPFSPGGSYILTKEKVHKYSRDFYEEMRSTLPYATRPVEAHCAERSYYLMWN